jgi:hypothetical protein
MNEKGREVEINGKKYNLVYTSAAMLGIIEKFGDVEGMADKLQENQAEAAHIVPWLISLLANQGIMLETGNAKPTNPDLIDSDWVALYTMPRDWEYLMGECMAAIAIGNGTYHETPKEGPVDVILEELQKNVEAGGE